ncbi:MAG: pteridine reductase [Burkholderiales bacterium]|jgi:pteridine reductase|nr:pteridine reductase [Burkholderiales bacterium]
MPNSESDKVVLITGGAKRVGAAICRMLHAAGCRLMIHYRSSRGEAEALAAELNGRRPDSVGLTQADLLDCAGLPRLVKDTLAKFGRLDVLINNASSFYPTEVGSITEENWTDLMGTNLKAPLFLAQAAADALRHARGAIVNIADIHAERPMKSYVVYSIAKAGLLALTKSLAHELGPYVRVNAIGPGPILWPEDDPTFDETERRRIIAHTLLKREGTPEDIARAVRFLIFDATYTTGHMLTVDGGRSASL